MSTVRSSTCVCCAPREYTYAEPAPPDWPDMRDMIWYAREYVANPSVTIAASPEGDTVYSREPTYGAFATIRGVANATALGAARVRTWLAGSVRPSNRWRST